MGYIVCRKIMKGDYTAYLKTHGSTLRDKAGARGETLDLQGGEALQLEEQVWSLCLGCC